MSPAFGFGRDLKWKSTPKSLASSAKPLSKEFSPPLNIKGNGSLSEIVKSLFCVQHKNFFASLKVNLGFNPQRFR